MVSSTDFDMSEWYFLDGESTHRGQICVRLSALQGYGLYTLEPIAQGLAIGVWSGSLFEEDAWVPDRYGLELRYDRHTAAIMTPVDEGAVDYSRHPFAAVNEPPVGRSANVYVRIETYEDDDGEVYLMAVFYAAVDIEAGEELFWYYGDRYGRDYEVGSACVAPSNPPYSDSRFRSVLRARLDSVYHVDLEDSTSSDDKEWTP